jgi:hypothetical protein
MERTERPLAKSSDACRRDYLVEITNASAMKNLFVAICAAARPRPVQAGERAPLTTGREDDREFSW